MEGPIKQYLDLLPYVSVFLIYICIKYQDKFFLEVQSSYFRRILQTTLSWNHSKFLISNHYG